MGLFKFDRLLTPSIIKVLFYIGVIASVISAFTIISSGVAMMQWQVWAGLASIVGGLLLVFVGIIASRVATEIIMVLFMIRDELVWQRQSRSQATPAE
ncbi:hypothetical protein TSH58p_25435 (plasmid) [Azospirillum sp. TSH58]|uniref:DUF4282 domain-containing protein n=1 Tax=Azospirillum sp. TSH58 TaxID=664962 RepID=UPI000D5FE9A7|nr:DUF4282 domain-containing protein [Azospirillum sp. TSH58]AWJ86792.1 hypothetical protein TSH58p_25435 [Azospirillum sp. TSH58]PWC62903.1 hypothetical protein TSH58_24615 [Azospirillum sp. TSH58]